MGINVATYCRERFNHEIELVIRLEETYAREKTEASLGRRRVGQTPQTLMLAWKSTFRAKELRGDIEAAHRDAQTFALAVLVEQHCPTCGPTEIEQHPRRNAMRCANCKEAR